MTLLGLLVFLVLLGVILYLLQLIPMDAVIRNIAYVLVLLFVIIWLVQLLGGFAGLGDIKLTR